MFYPQQMADLVELHFNNTAGNEDVFNIQEKTIAYYCNTLSENLDIHITPHTFRHSFAVMYLKKGGNSKNLQSLLGHKSRVSTAIYEQMTDEDRENEFRKIVKIKRSPK